MKKIALNCLIPAMFIIILGFVYHSSKESKSIIRRAEIEQAKLKQVQKELEVMTLSSKALSLEANNLHTKIKTALVTQCHTDNKILRDCLQNLPEKVCKEILPPLKNCAQYE